MIAHAQTDVPKLALTAAEAAEALGVSERHLQSLATSGQVPSLMLGHRRVFPVAVWEAWMRDRCKGWLPSSTEEGAL